MARTRVSWACWSIALMFAACAGMLGVSQDTIKAHMMNIMEKLDVRDRTDAVTIAFHRQLPDLQQQLERNRITGVFPVRALLQRKKPPGAIEHTFLRAGSIGQPLAATVRGSASS